MSSLALQLFVNLNKLLSLHKDAGLGSHYAKELVERVRLVHPERLECTDPSNAHTTALAAFSLGLALHDLRQSNGNPFTQHSVSDILKDALDRADDMLEQLQPGEVHLVLQAHEEYKTYMGARADLICARGSNTLLGRTRGVEDILPLATTPQPMWQHTPSWRIEESRPHLPLHASAIDVGPLELSELSQASTGGESFQTQRTGPQLSIEEEVEEAIVVAGPVEHTSLATQTARTQYQPHLPAQTMHPVRADRGAERELLHEEGLVGETIDDMLARQRRQADLRHPEIPMYASPSWEELNGTHASKVRGSVFEDSSWSDENALSTYLHSESAPDSTGAHGSAPRGTIPVLLWTAPTFLILPPLALFYAGVLWGRGEYRHSLLTLGLGAAGVGSMLWWWLR